VDFTGNGEYKENYSKFIILSDNSIWLWHNQNGCRRVVYQDGKFSSQVYKEKSGNLPSDQVQFVLESAKGEVWIGTNKGLLKYQNVKQLTSTHSNRAGSISFLMINTLVSLPIKMKSTVIPILRTNWKRLRR
jgi:ligand-binding sensor domain-containing protein